MCYGVSTGLTRTFPMHRMCEACQEGVGKESCSFSFYRAYTVRNVTCYTVTQTVTPSLYIRVLIETELVCSVVTMNRKDFPPRKGTRRPDAKRTLPSF